MTAASGCRVKPVRVRDAVEVVYDPWRWELLRALRARALQPVEAVPSSVLVGSVARGDVHEESDVDVALLQPEPPSLVEERLASQGLHPIARELVQATPLSTPKIYLHFEGNVKVSIPLARPSRLEEEFYRFAGSLNLEQLRADGRVPGVNKRLLAVIPTPSGHFEFSVMGREAEVARLLGVSLDIVRERVELLTRRDERGRSGLFLKCEIHSWETLEEAVVRLARRVPALRERLEHW